MAKELSRTKDTAHGAVIVQVEDKNGVVTPHTIYVLGLAGKTVDQAIADLLTATDAATDALDAAFASAGLG